jgi:hypothetical protein
MDGYKRLMRTIRQGTIFRSGKICRVEISGNSRKCLGFQEVRILMLLARVLKKIAFAGLSPVHIPRGTFPYGKREHGPSSGHYIHEPAENAVPPGRGTKSVCLRHDAGGFHFPRGERAL